MRRHYKWYTADQRSRLIDLARSGAAIPATAAQLGVTPSTAYNWTRVVRAASPAASQGTQGPGRRSPRPARPQFARLVPSHDSGATIAVRVAGAAIELRPGFDAELLQRVIAVLGGGPTVPIPRGGPAGRAVLATDRYLELSPQYWAATRGRLRSDQLAKPLGVFDVPPLLADPTEPALVAAVTL